MDIQFDQFIRGDICESHLMQFTHEFRGHVVDAKFHDLVNVQIFKTQFLQALNEVRRNIVIP